MNDYLAECMVKVRNTLAHALGYIDHTGEIAYDGTMEDLASDAARYIDLLEQQLISVTTIPSDGTPQRRTRKWHD